MSEKFKLGREEAMNIVLTNSTNLFETDLAKNKNLFETD
jgi:hypothetical protein